MNKIMSDRSQGVTFRVYGPETDKALRTLLHCHASVCEISSEIRMFSKWHSLAQQKLFLARELIKDAVSRPDSPVTLQEAHRQGAVQLMLQARRLMLVVVAQLYQHRVEQVASLDALAQWVGEDNSDYEALLTLSRQSGSWWYRLEQYAGWFERPVPERKVVSDDNLIAFAADTGPDVSYEQLLSVIDAAKAWLHALMERHGEW